MARWNYTHGLHDLGGGSWAWLQPDGGWGWSNAGIVTDGEASLLVDTLFDKPLTREMLSAMRDAAPGATNRFDTLVNTHANGDHCHGNELVHSPVDGVVFTGDILFIESTPVMWQGPVGNWIKACNLIEDMEADLIVPGHGPITDKHGVVQVRHYLQYVHDQARIRYDAGMDAFEAAKDIELNEYSSWSDPERIAVNVDSLYREFSGQQTQTELFELMGRMAELAGFGTSG